MLNPTKKYRSIPALVARDLIYACFFCGDRFVEGDKYLDRTYHHLDKNIKNDELWNLVLAHNICNIKVENYIEWQVISQDKMLWNINHQPTVEQVKMATDSLMRDGVGIMIELNVHHMKICEEYLKEKLAVEPFLRFSDVQASCTFLCREETGHGSLQSTRNYLLVLCAEEATYERVKLSGVTIIRKRAGK